MPFAVALRALTCKKLKCNATAPVSLSHITAQRQKCGSWQYFPIWILAQEALLPLSGKTQVLSYNKNNTRHHQKLKKKQVQHYLTQHVIGISSSLNLSIIIIHFCDWRVITRLLISIRRCTWLAHFCLPFFSFIGVYDHLPSLSVTR